MHGFYELPKYKQWMIAIPLAILCLLPVVIVVDKIYGLLLLPFLAPVFNFGTVPLFRLMGYYKYLTPLVLSTVQTDKNYDLHNVFTFDYFVNFKWSDRGMPVQKKLLQHYFKALLVIIERIEAGQLSPEVKIVGNSYFFSDRTAKKLGFTIEKANAFWIINSVFQFVELSYLYSFSRGKWAFPKFWKVQKAEIKGKDLINKKAFLEGLVKKLGQNKTSA